MSHPVFGPPRATLEAALEALARNGIPPRRRSRWYRSAPVPASGQPWFVNGVAEVDSPLAPDELLARLHEVEDSFGRVRPRPNAPRVLDLDLLDWRGEVRAAPRRAGGAVLPHPRLRERCFVLLPLRELAPRWVHPETGESLDALIAALPGDQHCEPMEEEGPGP